MPLSDLLYRCPACGHDPLVKVRGGARCGGCGGHFEAGGAGGRLRRLGPGGEEEELPAVEWVGRLRSHETGPPGARPGAGGILLRSRVRLRVAREEDPIRRDGLLLGFVERPGPATDGWLSLSEGKLTFDGEGGERLDWSLLDLRAVQASSASIQLSPRAGGLFLFRFRSDSPRRWEELLRDRIAVSWREEGRGEVFEFQPRIRAR